MQCLAAALIGALAAVVSLCVRAQGATYAIDPTHTFVNFEAAHFGTSTSRGRFDRKQGTVKFDRAGRTGRVQIGIDTASVSTGVVALDKRLCAADVLDCEANPNALFTAESLAFVGDKVSEVIGSLALRGRTLPLTLQATRFDCYLNPLLLREVCGGDFETVLVLSDWGIGKGPGLPDAVRLLVQVEAIRP